jgi:hypothetical protein
LYTREKIFNCAGECGLANLLALTPARAKDGYLSNIFFASSPLKQAARAQELLRKTTAAKGASGN